MSLHSSDITLKDLFCGCGGSTSGAVNVPGVHVKYAMNHWKLAVESHNTNHPDTFHDCADISETHPARYERTTGLIGSPECTNHSGAKGKRRKNLNQGELFQNKAIDPSAIKSRATMWDIVRFAEIHRYEFVITENVVEVRDWVLFEPWLKAMHSLGYVHKCVFLNAMFAHGENIKGFAPQSRDRIYIVFWKKGNKAPDLEIRPLAPCPRCGVKETYQSWKNGRIAGKFKTQYVFRCSGCNEVVMPFYYAALNAIDFSIPMVKIGERHLNKMPPLCAKTRQRIEYGLGKFGLRPTIIDQRNPSGSVRARIRTADDSPMNTQSTGYSSYLFSPFLVDTSFAHSKSDRTYGPNDVMPTLTTQQSLTLVAPSAILTMRGNRTLDAMTDPISTQVAAGIQNWLVSSKPFLTPYHGNAQAAQLTDPTYTIPTKDSLSLVETHNQPSVDDCYFRMLQPSETALAQGFPKDYIILGNKEDRQKQIGNANPPPTMELLVSRCVASLS